MPANVLATSRARLAFVMRILLLSSVLTACSGGSGGDNRPSEPPATTPIALQSQDRVESPTLAPQPSDFVALGIETTPAPNPAPTPVHTTVPTQIPTPPPVSPVPTPDITPSPSPIPVTTTKDEEEDSDEPRIDIAGTWFMEVDAMQFALSTFSTGLIEVSDMLAPGQKLLVIDLPDEERIGISNCYGSIPQSTYLSRPDGTNDINARGTWTIHSLEFFGPLDMNVHMDISDKNHIDVDFLPDLSSPVHVDMTRIDNAASFHLVTADSASSQGDGCVLARRENAAGPIDLHLTTYWQGHFLQLVLQGFTTSQQYYYRDQTLLVKSTKPALVDPLIDHIAVSVLIGSEVDLELKLSIYDAEAQFQFGGQVLIPEYEISEPVPLYF